MDAETLNSHVDSICETYIDYLSGKLNLEQAKMAVVLRLNLLKKHELNLGEYSQRIQQVFSKGNKSITLNLVYKGEKHTEHNVQLSLLPDYKTESAQVLIPPGRGSYVYDQVKKTVVTHNTKSSRSDSDQDSEKESDQGSDQGSGQES